MRKLCYILLAVILVACNEKKEADTETDVRDTITNVNTRLLIVPGKSIGNISLGQNAESLEPILGKPDLSDAAMGKAWLTWFSKVSDTVTGNELNIYTEYKDDELREKVVQQIRITSDEFSTETGLHTGMLLEDISRLTRGTLTMVGQYDSATPNPVRVFDHIDAGIAFEIENDNRCSGIIIHEKGKKVSGTYITFHPDMMPM